MWRHNLCNDDSMAEVIDVSRGNLDDWDFLTATFDDSIKTIESGLDEYDGGDDGEAPFVHNNHDVPRITIDTCVAPRRISTNDTPFHCDKVDGQNAPAFNDHASCAEPNQVHFVMDTSDRMIHPSAPCINFDSHPSQVYHSDMSHFGATGIGNNKPTWGYTSDRFNSSFLTNGPPIVGAFCTADENADMRIQTPLMTASGVDPSNFDVGAAWKQPDSVAVMVPSVELAPKQPPRSTKGSRRSRKSTTTIKQGEQAICKPMKVYNHYYRDERENILQGLKKADDPLPPPVCDFSQTKLEQLLHRRWFVDPMQARRPHRKSHGKIEFQQLSKVIAGRWRNLSPSGREFYRRVAQVDQERYDEIMRQRIVTDKA